MESTYREFQINKDQNMYFNLSINLLIEVQISICTAILAFTSKWQYTNLFFFYKAAQLSFAACLPLNHVHHVCQWQSRFAVRSTIDIHD